MPAGKVSVERLIRKTPSRFQKIRLIAQAAADARGFNVAGMARRL